MENQQPKPDITCIQVREDLHIVRKKSEDGASQIIVCHQDPTLSRIYKLDLGRKQGSTEWDWDRCGMYTASDVAGLLGLNKYTSEAQIWHKKLGLPDPKAKGKQTTSSRYGGTWMMERGSYYEHIAASLYAQQYGVDIYHYDLCVHPDIPWLGASPDGVTADGTLIEIKVPATRTTQQGVVAPYIFPQIQTTLEVLDLEKAHLVEFVPTTHNDGAVVVTEVVRDRSWWKLWYPVLALSYSEFRPKFEERKEELKKLVAARRPRELMLKGVSTCMTAYVERKMGANKKMDLSVG